MGIHEWIQQGIEKGFCSPIVCQTHDGAPMTEEESNEFDEGYDPCITIVRVYPEGRPDSK